MLNRHSRLRGLISAYVDGQVTESERSRVEAHLAGCEPCRSDLESLRTTVSLLRALPELRVPRSFALHEAPARVTPTSRLLWGTRLATAAAGSLVAALLIGNAVGVFVQSGRVSGLDGAAPEVAAAKVAPQAQAPSTPAALPSPAPAPEVAAAAAAPPPAAPAAPVAAMAAPAPAVADADAGEEAVEEEAEEAPVAGRREVETATASELPTPAPEPATRLATPAVRAAEAAVVEEDEAEPDTDDGLRVPLWQLEAAAGGLFALLAAATGWLALRSRRRPF
ncbi:MAG: zf-HC2 domain-containing protein [Chloroflexi bacterium]|nr:zf-HC2 domain-containing protein [Chloroflexota bacterium]